MSQKPIIEFPCKFPIKIICIHSSSIIDEIISITQKHFGDFTEQALTHKPSKNNNYIAITVEVMAQNQKHLDGYYIEVSSRADIKMVL
jgi:putative lipoic acid-binding regulatory protein